ncbi:MAG: hypothetical protein N2484_14770 [Clostridia bacterium]|nr:hypothetical protein [Clostridia bacterium]
MLIGVVLIFTIFIASAAIIGCRSIGVTLKWKSYDQLQQGTFSSRILRLVTLIAVLLQVTFWVLYLSSILTKFQEWVAEVYWVGAGIAGVIIGIFGAIKFSRKVVPSYISLIGGSLLIALYLLARFITSM